MICLRFLVIHTMRCSWLAAIFLLTTFLRCAADSQNGKSMSDGSSSLTSIRSLLDQSPSEGQAFLRGSVTYIGRELIVQDQTGAISIEAPSGVSVSLGDEVEVSGQLEKRPGIPIVRNATVQVLWAGSTPLPLAMSPDDAAEGAYNGMLVSTEGRLIKFTSDSGSRLRLTMESGSQLFTCALDRDAVPASKIPELGATVRCTGVLAVEQGTVVLDTGPFVILLRDRQDIHVLAGAPWWSPRHLVMLFFAFLVAAWMVYRIHLRNIRDRMQMVLEERSRIAREIHDTLAQGFAGIALQLQSLDRTMEKRSAISDSHLSMALQMVRRSRAEAHRSIATLRTLPSNQNLASVTERLLRQLIQSSSLRLIVEECGLARPFSDEVATQILRISQEAVANIVEHARANSVLIRFDYQPEHFLLEVIDDGCGFDPERARSLDEGHFGIAGMRERAHQIGADLTIESDAEGTLLRLEMPLRPFRPWTQWLRKQKKYTRHRFHHKSRVNTTND
jgi:signal transduction histidine kinase